jgi:hypothetical protein
LVAFEIFPSSMANVAVADVAFGSHGREKARRTGRRTLSLSM